MNQHPLTDKNRLSITHPELCKEWDYEKNYPLRPEQVSRCSNKQVWWICKKKHSWQVSVVKRAISKHGCPYCSGHRACIENCLDSLKPEIAKEWHPTRNGNCTPKDVTCGSNKRAFWICKKKHIYEMSIVNRSMGQGCPYCSGHKVCEDNCLKTNSPKLCKEWDYEKNYPLRPENVSQCSSKKVWWKCGHKHNWQSDISNRVNGQNCPYCCRYRPEYAIPEKHKLANANPDLRNEWDYKKNGKLTPENVIHYSRKRVGWICPNNHHYDAIINDRANHNCGCPYCSGRRVCEDNCLAVLNPKLAKQWHPTRNGKLTPNNVTPYSNKKVWWYCFECKYEWKVTVAHRSSGYNCSRCHTNKIIKRNCLAVVNPDLARQWHPIKNGKLTPHDVACGSARPVWWQCPTCKHEWQAGICHRNSGNACPMCAKIVLKDGTSWDSKIEAYYYLKLKGRNIKYISNKEYGFTNKKYRFDFYIPKFETYVEITSFLKRDMRSKAFKRLWKRYIKKIHEKKDFVENVLHKKFRFIQFTLNRRQKRVVSNNTL